jgi:hypothetical protein
MTTRSLSTKAAAPKKAPAKKTTPKKAAALMVVSDSLSFWTIDGQQLTSLHDLAKALGKMERRVYNYHADAAYSDFAKWVAGALKDKACGAALKKAMTAKDAMAIVTEHLKKYGV